ncbi:hypothetical protein LIS90_13580, partial [Flavobacterium psychrophilum]|nr:hypothetical protein [Flavobacterium psychrophilum]
MAKVSITTIYNWFTTGSKPTQAQFWDTWDSFWHKDDKIPIAQVEGVQSICDAINNHIKDTNAHAGLLAYSRIYPFGTFQIFKAAGNTNGETLEIRDFGTGFINEATFMPFGIFLGGNPKELASWDTSPMYYPTPEVIPTLPIPGEVSR